jgi:membrane protease YdiL (CAAX protease family)
MLAVMSTLILDRSWRFQTLPPFLALAGEPRGASRTVVFLLLAVPAALTAALVTGLVVTLVAAAGLAGASGQDLLQAVGVLIDSARAPRPLISYAFELVVAGLSSYAAAMAALAIAARIYRRPLRSFLTAAARFRWRAVGAGLLVGFPLVAAAYLLERIGSHEAAAAPLLRPDAGGLERLGYAACAAAMLYLAAFAEEALFRGWLLQQTATWTRRLAIILAVNGVVFSLAHFDPNPASFLVRAVMGAGWAWIALRTDGVEFTTGAHLANNLFVALFVAPVSFAAVKPAPFDYRPALVELAVVLLMAGIVELYARRSAARPEPAAG